MLKKRIINNLTRKRLTRIDYSACDQSRRVVIVYSFKKERNAVTGRNIDNDKVVVVSLNNILNVIPLIRDRKKRCLRKNE